MNLSEDQIDNTLRHAPQPAPAPTLRHRLVQDIGLPGAGSRYADAAAPRGLWVRRWWPALAAGTVAASALAVVVVQQNHLDQLEQRIEALSHELSAPPPETGPSPSPASQTPATVPYEGGASELEALRVRVGELTAAVEALEALPAENAQLKAQAIANLGLSPEALAELVQAKERAQCITCVNNLKQLGLAARIWATDNGDVLPPDFITMSNEIASPKILVCPADSGRQPAGDWGSFTAANASYEYLAANSTETEPQRVAFRCPVHGNIGLVDGSVQMRVAREHPEWLVQRDGKWMLERPSSPTPSPTSPPGPGAQMDPRLTERYGLVAPGTPGGSTAPGQAQQMSPEMMRRYGLQPPPEPQTDSVPEPTSELEDQP